jgi:antitoxin (DNA-binding transcriptional repressor) of toxin-antitoxin stability system
MYFKIKIMLVVSTREFRDNQKSYLDKIDSGMEVLIQRGKRRSYKIVPVANDDTLMSKEDFFAKIDRSLQEAKEGKVYSMLPGESLSAFLIRTENV